MGRLAWYAGVSTALAGGVVISAFNQRANFYSACVYLAQSNLCLMILINLILFIYGSFMYGLQRLCYGQLRPIEIEQLYEKAWFAITETCLAMTIFREEVGAWFLVMFVALLTGKVWGWIGDGRVEILEQQPPANPRLFHIRLSISLAASVLYDIWLMSYTIDTVVQQARPNMMVMFLFEFAILTTSSMSTAVRYTISLAEARVVKKQTQDRLIERRREVSEEREEMIRQREAAEASGEAPATDPLPSEDDVDEMDIEVPGWDAKGQWILTLDLLTDLMKLGIYVLFFFILLMFYGMPIHIMRDLFMTTRSFIKRLTAFLRYRRATHDMNKRYADATVEDIQREDTCIICREEMRPWSVTNPQVPPDAPGVPPPNRPATLNERTRPKKLPCGHILHLGCLKSWLERQQVCPTCRNPVVDSVQPRAATNNGNLPAGQAAQQPLPAQQQPLPGQLDGAGAGAAPPAPRGGRGMRMLNFGPLRLGFGQANLQDLAQGFGGPQNQNQENPVAGGARVYGLELGFPRRLQPQPQQGQAATGAAGSPTLQDHIQRIEQYIAAEIGNLRVAQQELQLVQLLQVELARLRLLQNGTTDGTTGNFQTPQAGGAISRQTAPFSTPLPHMQRHGANPDAQAIPAGSADLPPGITIPEGWSLLPLQRLDNSAVTQTGAVPASNVGLVPTATTTQTVTSPMPGTSNDIPAMTATNPDRQSQASSVDSSDTNAIHTPPSIIADQLNAATSTSTTTTLPNITSSTTPASLPLSNPSVLPNWGSSQPFSGHTPTDNTNSHAPPPNPGEDNSLIEEGHSSFFSTGTSDQGSEEYRQDKGKGRAATVEDTIDDAEGA